MQHRQTTIGMYLQPCTRCHSTHLCIQAVMSCRAGHMQFSNFDWAFTMGQFKNELVQIAVWHMSYHLKTHFYCMWGTEIMYCPHSWSKENQNWHMHRSACENFFRPSSERMGFEDFSSSDRHVYSTQWLICKTKIMWAVHIYMPYQLMICSHFRLFLIFCCCFYGGGGPHIKEGKCGFYHSGRLSGKPNPPHSKYLILFVIVWFDSLSPSQHFFRHFGQSSWVIPVLRRG